MPNKFKNHTSTFVYYFPFVKQDFLTLRKTGLPKTRAAGPLPPAMYK